MGGAVTKRRNRRGNRKHLRRLETFVSVVEKNRYLNLPPNFESRFLSAWLKKV